MANEAVLKQWQEDPIDFIVGDSIGIEKGTILALEDARTASGAIALSARPIAGIARREKIANDGRTRLALFRKGVFDISASGAIVVGDVVVFDDAPNHVKSLDTAAGAHASGAQVLGTALETAADGEVIEVAVNL